MSDGRYEAGRSARARRRGRVAFPAAPADVGGPHGLALTVHQELRQLILDGSVEPGTTLNQAELARDFGVSRTPMREAFRMLQEEGLIQAEPDRRAVVVGLDLADLDAMYGARLMLEALAVSRTVPVISPEELEALEDALTRMRENSGGAANLRRLEPGTRRIPPPGDHGRGCAGAPAARFAEGSGHTPYCVLPSPARQRTGGRPNAVTRRSWTRLSAKTPRPRPRPWPSISRRPRCGSSQAPIPDATSPPCRPPWPWCAAVAATGARPASPDRRGPVPRDTHAREHYSR